MTHAEGRPPAFEFEVAAHTREMTFHEVGDVEWTAEGSVQAEWVSRRDGLPPAVRPHVRYEDVQVSARLEAWLGDTDPPQQTDPPARGTDPGGG